MKRRWAGIAVILVLALSGCSPSVPVPIESEKKVKERDTINIKINGQVASIQLEDNATTKAIVAKAPFTIQMDDLHRNEKYHYFDKSFPTNPQAIQTIEAGDVLLYQNNCLVIFYKATKPVASYTRIGNISNIQDIQPLLDQESVTVKWY